MLYIKDSSTGFCYGSGIRRVPLLWSPSTSHRATPTAYTATPKFPIATQAFSTTNSDRRRAIFARAG